MNHETIINAASYQLAAAIAEAECTAAVLAAAQERVDQIESRLQEKAAGRAAIISRRAAGNPQPTDGQEAAVRQHHGD
jgi:hypothetical protein